jgi:hypothetical protein
VFLILPFFFSRTCAECLASLAYLETLNFIYGSSLPSSQPTLHLPSLQSLSSSQTYELQYFDAPNLLGPVLTIPQSSTRVDTVRLPCQVEMIPASPCLETQHASHALSETKGYMGFITEHSARPEEIESRVFFFIEVGKNNAGLAKVDIIASAIAMPMGAFWRTSRL